MLDASAAVIVVGVAIVILDNYHVCFNSEVEASVTHLPGPWDPPWLYPSAEPGRLEPRAATVSVGNVFTKELRHESQAIAGYRLRADARDMP